MTPKYRLGEMLTSGEVITPQQLDEALIFQQQHHLPIGEALVNLGYLTPQQVRFILVKQQWLRRTASILALVLAPFHYAHSEQTELEKLPEYSYTQVAQNPCPFQAVYSRFNAQSDEQEYDLLEASTAALWYVSQGGVNSDGLADVPVQVHLTSKDYKEGLSVNFSVRF